MKTIKAAIYQKITFHHLTMVMAAVIVFTTCTSITVPLYADHLSQRPVKETIVIEKKSRTQLEDSSYRQYQVSQRTLIMGVDGKQVRYFDMPVPCEAEVHYRVEKGHRQLLMVKMILIMSGSGSSFTKDIVE